MQKLLQQQAEFDQQIAASQVNIEVVSGSKGTHRKIKLVSGSKGTNVISDNTK